MSEAIILFIEFIKGEHLSCCLEITPCFVSALAKFIDLFRKICLAFLSSIDKQGSDFVNFECLSNLFNGIKSNLFVDFVFRTSFINSNLISSSSHYLNKKYQCCYLKYCDSSHFIDTAAKLLFVERCFDYWFQYQNLF